MNQIGNSVQDVEIREDAPMSAAVLAKLRDMDSNRIADTDRVVMHKAVLALLAMVSELEVRVNALDGGAANGELQGVGARSGV